jgi:predicted esterase
LEDLDDAHDEPSILRSRGIINDLLSSEISADVPADRIVLGGFSQGGDMSILTGLTTTHKLAGIFALAAHLVLSNKIKTLADESGNVNRDSKWFMGHGDADKLIRYDWGVRTAEVLKKDLGVKDLEFKTYHGLAHTADPLEIDHVEAFLKRCLPPLDDK